MLSISSSQSANKISGERSRSCPCEPNPHTKCVDGFCKCVEGFTLHEDSNKCVPKLVLLGKSCETTDQCKEFEKFSECSDKVCKCTKRFVEIVNQCRSMVNRGKSICKDINDCHEHEECLKDGCVCMKGFIASEVKVSKKFSRAIKI